MRDRSATERDRGARCRRAAALAATALVAVTGLAAAPAGAVSLGLSPPAVSPAPGGSFAVDLVVSDLAGAVVGGFDVTLGFDPTALAIAGVSFDSQLGAIPAEATAEAIGGTGTLSLAAFSILSTAALEALQGDSVRLATIVFEATSAAPSAIGIAAALLADGPGAPLVLGAPPSGTNVTPIPEPAGALVFALGVGLTAAATRRRSGSARAR